MTWHIAAHAFFSSGGISASIWAPAATFAARSPARMKLKRYRELLEFYYIQRVKGFDVPDAPVLELETAEFFRCMLRRAKLYVEFGSGGSTILADRLGIRTISVEGDRYFAAAVRRRLTGSSVTLLTPNIGITAPWGYPLLRRPTEPRKRRWRRYVEAPFMGDAPDLILVDGRFRVACTLEAARRAHQAQSPATLIFEDYASRPQYKMVEKHLGVPQMIGRAAVFKIGDQKVPDLDVEDVS